jgi:F0F1-type ATP synthase membrane subunit b/b'
VSKLLEPDFWVAIWNKLLDPDFWMTLWSKLLDPDFWMTLWSKLLGFDLWGTVWKAFSTPEVIITLVPLLLIATYVGWKIKGGFANEKIKGMKTQIDAAERRLLSANEQRAVGADIDREVETLCKQVFDLKTRLETGVQPSELAARVGAIAQTVTKLHSANNELQRTFIGPRDPATTQDVSS